MDAQLLRAPALPPSLLRWIPYLWQNVLFPGTATPEGASVRRASLLWLIFIPGILLYPCLAFPLFEPDETRYAQIPNEMLQQGEWVVPLLQSEPYLDKPPLFYWLVKISYAIFGVSIPAARLIPALAVHLSILLVYLFGRRWMPEKAALRGALVLALAPGFLNMGRLLLLDGLLTLWVTLCILSAYESLQRSKLHRGWWALSAVSCGLGILTKGPVIGLLLIPPLLLQGWLMGNLARPSYKAILTYLGIATLIALPWFIALGIREPVFVRYFFWEHNVLRFLAPFDHQRGVWFYVPILLAGLLPATLLLIPFLRFLISGDENDARTRAPILSFLLLTGGWCLFFFTLSGSKLPTYILPAFPFLSLALGYYLSVSRWQSSRWPVRMAGIAFVFLLMIHFVLLPWYANYRSPVKNPEALVRHCSDPKASVVCYPRPCNSVAFHLNRSDFQNYRSKEIEDLRTLVRMQPRTIILCTHRHSLAGLRQLLPPEVEIVETVHFGLGKIEGIPKAWMPRVQKLLGETRLGLCDLAVIEYPAMTRAGRAGPVMAPVK